MKTTHPKIGDYKVLIEAEVAGKFFALIQSHTGPTYDRMDSRKVTFFTYSWSKPRDKPKSHYYVLWGNTPDFATMGITQLLTDKLNAVAPSTIVKRFFEIINASENITFLK